ncbi:hypothetical protein ACJZ2D_004223 [Fusarium nematophilum]
MAENNKNLTTQLLQPAQQPEPGPGDTPFLKLPKELRDEIYSYLFCSTRLTFGNRFQGFEGNYRIAPARHSLALLRTCRQVRDEVGDRWISEVLFNFKTPHTLLDKLSVLPRCTLGKIRHVRIDDGEVSLDIPGPPGRLGGSNYHDYFLDSIFELLPGLRLDQLTIIAPPGASYTSSCIANSLVSSGEGWKEFRPVLREGLLPSPWDGDPAAKFYQFWSENVQNWQETLKLRDGEPSAPSVAAYQSAAPKIVGAVLDPRAREQFDRRTFRYTENQDECHGPAEIMVVVKRGADVDYEVKSDSPKKPKLLEDTAADTWCEIRGMCCDRDYKFCKDIDERELVMRDSYVSVDDFDDMDVLVAIWRPSRLD